ncbi:MAG: hypothetical protein WB780_00810 [Candidatus Acidiferrales bacterium]
MNSFAPSIGKGGTTSEGSGVGYFRLIAIVFVLNVISAALFMHFVDRPVYDDQYNIYDVHAYATKGLSVPAIHAQRNPPGPASFLWMAAMVRLLAGDELLDARIGALLSWVLLVVGLLVGARFSYTPRLWHGALLASLVFPHSVTATATVLTEGPALLFAVLGAMTWVECASRPVSTPALLVWEMMGGLSMGVAVTCRQYYLALLPAAAMLALFQFRQRDPVKKPLWATGVILSLAIAALPVLLLVLVWKGISSPGMATGTSYDMVWKARAGVSLLRPILAAFYAAFYFLPLAFPVALGVKFPHRWRAILAASLGGVVVAYFRSWFLQPGPLHTLIHSASRVRGGAFILALSIAALTIYAAIALSMRLRREATLLFSNPAVAFAFLTIVFFVFEQIGVGGNIPLYDRYILQIAPFLGLLAFSLYPRLTYGRILTIAASSIVSHVMLWRYVLDK